MTKKKNQQDPELSEKEVWNIIDFSNALNSLYPAVYTPQLINARLQDVSLMNTGQVTESRVSRALSNPKTSEKELLAISEALEYSSPSYKRILEYISSLPGWDLKYSCKNIGDVSNYKSKKYQESLDVVAEFFSKFDYRNEFKTILKQLFRQETFFGVFRKEGDKYVIQELASDYCLITGRWDYGLLFSFDYMFFNRGGIDIDMFPPIFKETYLKLFTKNNMNNYDPSINVDLRSDSTWVYIADCSPADGFWGWKLQPQLISRIPYYCGLFPDFSSQDFIRNLQKNSYMAAAAKLIFGEVPYLKDTKANVKDAIAINPTLLGQFLQLVKSGINNEAVKVTSAPLQNIKQFEFTSDNDIYSTWQRTTMGGAGVNSNLLFSSDTKMNSLETGLSANIDEIISQSVYPYFNNFLDYHVNNELKDRKCKYRFRFNFKGSNFYTDRQRRLESAIQLANIGIVLPQEFSAALGEDPFVFQAQLDEARVNGWTDNLTPIVSAFQQSGDSSKQTGRPSKSESELSDSGMQTRDDASNISKIKSNK